jgi:hypothetical protein
MLFGNDIGTGASLQNTHGRKGMYRFGMPTVSPSLL